MKYIPSFDGLRALAVILVLIFHLDRRILPAEFSILYEELKIGKLGVNVFFILSGYLVTGILMRSVDSWSSLKVFLIRRTLRTFPIYYLTVLAVFLIFPGTQLLSALFYATNYTNAFQEAATALNHTWSLCVEEHFYLIWPLLFLLFQRHVGAAALGFLGLCFTLSFLTPAFFDNETSRKLIAEGTHTQVMGLAIGCWLAQMRVKGRENILRALSLGLVIISGIFLLRNWMDFFGEQKYLARQIIYTAMALGFFLPVLAGAFGERDPLAKTLSTRWLVWIGRRSYGIYLYHLPIYFLLNVIDGSVLPTPRPFYWAILAPAITLAFAGLSFAFIETYFLKWKDRFGY